MSYRKGVRTQQTLFPSSVDEYISSDDPVRVYDALVDSLDVESLGLTLNDQAVGNSSYHPVTMLKILIYAYSYGWRSSRKIERALHHNLSFIWLAENLKPDHKTISKFRKDNKLVLKKTLVHCARLCVKLGMIEGNTLFIDGSKFRANASINQSKNIDSWARYRDHVENRIDELLNEAQNLDVTEKESLVSINKELKGKKKLKARIEELLTEQSEQGKINKTDPESKVMKGRQGTHACYNVQATTDEKHGLIVSMDTSNSGNDLNAFSQSVDAAEETLEKPCEIACADAGYSSVDDLKKTVDKGRVVVVPTTRQAKEQVVNPFDKKHFIYDQKKDQYTCPKGEKLNACIHRKDDNRIEYRMINRKACVGCEHFKICTKSKHGRTISRLINQETKEELGRIYDSKLGQEVYNKRKSKVELQFGHIKRNLGAGYFLIRGKEGAEAELGILGTCFNVARMITIFGGVREILKVLSPKTL